MGHGRQTLRLHHQTTSQRPPPRSVAGMLHIFMKLSHAENFTKSFIKNLYEDFLKFTHV